MWGRVLHVARIESGGRRYAAATLSAYYAAAHALAPVQLLRMAANSAYLAWLCVLQHETGNEVIALTAFFCNQVPQYQTQVIVRECMRGEVQASPQMCMLCPAATYSLDPANQTCDSPCPDDAECRGGAVLVPELGYWHSAANSAYMAQCPNAAACSGDREQLVTCQGDAYAPPSITGQTEVRVCMPCIVCCDAQRKPTCLVLNGHCDSALSEHQSCRVMPLVENHWCNDHVHA